MDLSRIQDLGKQVPDPGHARGKVQPPGSEFDNGYELEHLPMEVRVGLDIAFDDHGYGKPAAQPVGNQRIDCLPRFCTEPTPGTRVQEEVGEGSSHAPDATTERRCRPTCRSGLRQVEYDGRTPP